MVSGYDEWNKVYRRYPLETLPWELGKPKKVSVKLVEKGLVKRGRALDICCEAGTNTVYLARKGFLVTRIDISSKAIEYAKKEDCRGWRQSQVYIKNLAFLFIKRSVLAVR